VSSSRRKTEGRAGQLQYGVLFATPVIFDRLVDEPLIAELERAILKRRSENPGLTRSNVGGWQSDEGLFDWGGEPARRLLSHIFDLATSQTILKSPEPSLTFDWAADGWANVNRPGDSNLAHAHGGCFWAAVFYVRVDPGMGGELVLYDPRLPAIEMYAPQLWFAGSGVQRQGRIKPRAGMLVLFPTWLVHSVAPWFGEGLRISIAVNLRAQLHSRGTGPR